MWLGSFQAGEFLQTSGYNDLAIAAYGYVMGCITVFSGHLFWGRVVQTRGNELLGEGWFSRAVFAICLIVIFSMGLLGVYNSIFNASPRAYCMLFLVGGIVVNQGLMPIIEHFDGGRTKSAAH